jgi:hypothetical protein
MWWELTMTIVLLTTCILTPLDIAFSFSQDDESWNWMLNTIDILFLTDILIIFNSVYYDDEFKLVENRKAICINYL